MGVVPETERSTAAATMHTVHLWLWPCDIAYNPVQHRKLPAVWAGLQQHPDAAEMSAFLVQC